MNFRLPSLLTLVCLFGCERSAARQTTDSVSTVVTQNAQPPSPPSVEDSAFDNSGDSPDSSYGKWDQEGFVSGNHVRHPSGLLVLWLDTAIRATEDHPIGRAHAVSIAVRGLQSGEGLTRYCAVSGNPTNRIVGIVRDTTVGIHPRLAWLFDDSTFRIKATPTDSLICFLRDPMEGEDVD